MVVGFIFEKEEPIFRPIDGVDLDFDGASIHFFRSVQIFQLALLAERLHSGGGHIHQSHRTLSIGAIEMDAGLFVFLQGLGNRSRKLPFLYIDSSKLRGECGVTAMVRPIGVQHADFRHSRVTLLFIPEIIADHSQIPVAHGETHRRNQRIDACIIQISHALYHRHRLRVFDGKIQGFCFSKARFSRLHRVHQEFQNLFPVPFSEMAIKGVHQSATHPRAVLARHDSQALLRRVRSLVILPREEFHSHHQVALGQCGCRLIHRRLREHSGYGLLVIRVGQSVHIIAMINPASLDAIS